MLCRALLDRVTDQVHILETDIDCYRFRTVTRQEDPRGIRAVGLTLRTYTFAPAQDKEKRSF